LLDSLLQENYTLEIAAAAMATLKLSSPGSWLDSLATLPDCDVSDLCNEVLLVGSEGDTTSIATVTLLATSQLFRQLQLQDRGEEGGYCSGQLLIFPDVANVHLEQVVHLLTSGSSEQPGDLRKVGRDLQQVQYVMNLLLTGIDVSLAHIKPSQDVEEINNNIGQVSLERPPRNKYSRRELKNLIGNFNKAGRPSSAQRSTSASLFCKICQKSVSETESLRSHTKRYHPESTFACKVCDQRFIYEVNLRKHMAAKHPDKKSEEICVAQARTKSNCPHCSKLIGNKYMKTHIDSVHKGLRYECGDCKFISTNRARVRKHCEDQSHKSDGIRQVHVRPSTLREHWTLQRGT